MSATYFDHVSGTKPAYDTVPAPSFGDALAVVIRHHIHEGRFIVKDGTRPVGCFSYCDEASFRQAQERARVCKSRYERGSVEQVSL